MKNLLSYSSSLSTQFFYASSANRSFLMEKNNLPNLATAPLQPRPRKRHSGQHARTWYRLDPVWAAHRRARAPKERAGGLSEASSLTQREGTVRLAPCLLCLGHTCSANNAFLVQVMSGGKGIKAGSFLGTESHFGHSRPQTKSSPNKHTTFFSSVPS